MMSHEKKTLIFRILALLFYVIFIISCIVYLNRPELYVRPQIYFISILSMILIAFLEALITFNDASWGRTLFFSIQIFLIALSTTLTQIELYPSITGVDTWTHKTLVEFIVSSGHLPRGTYFLGGASVYLKMPSFHILLSSQILISDLSYKWTSFLSIGLVSFILEITGIYLIVLRIFHNHKQASLAIIFIAIADVIINMIGINIIPNTIGVAIVVMGLYLWIVYREKLLNNTRQVILFIILAFGLVFMHSLSYAFLIWQSLIIFMFLWADKNTRKKRSIATWITIIFILALFEWGLVSQLYLRSSILILKNLFVYGINPSHNYGSKIYIPLKYALLSRMGMFMYFAFMGGGILIALLNGKNQRSFPLLVIVVLGIVFSMLVLFTPVLSSITGRYRYYTGVTGSIFAAFLLDKIWELKIRHAKIQKVTQISEFFIVGVMAFLMILSPIANEDNPITGKYTSRTGLYTSEISAAEFVIFKLPRSIPISSDSLYTADIIYMTSWVDKKTMPRKATYPTSFEDVFCLKENPVFLLRKDLVKNRAFTLGKGSTAIRYPPLTPKEFQIIMSCVSSCADITYNNEDVIIFKG